MRILFVISTVDPKFGGPIEAVRQVIDPLLRKGHEVEVLAADAPGADFAADYPVPLHLCGPWRNGYAYSPDMRPWLLEHMGEYDAVVCRGIWQYQNIAVHSVARRLGRPYWVFTHGMLDPYFNRASKLKRIRNSLYWPWQHRVLRDAEAVLFTSEEERLLARQAFRPYRVRERVVSYGTASPPPEPEHQLDAFITAFSRLHGKRFLLYLSRIHPKKGVDLLLQAWPRASATDPELELAIAGPVAPEYKAVIDRMAAQMPGSGKVHWLGMLQGDLKWGAFRGCEAYILPSHQENFGIAVVEALACGRPVLITRRVNIWREIEAEGAGIVDEDTADGVAELLQRWNATDPATRAAMGEAALRSFESRFTIDRSADSLIAALDEGRARFLNSNR